MALVLVMTVWTCHHRETKATTKKWDNVKLKIFCTAKENNRRQPIEWEGMFANCVHVKGPVSKIYEELI